MSIAGALNVQVLSLCMDMTNWAASERSFRIILEKLNVNGINGGGGSGEQQPMILLEGREKKGLADEAENEEKGQYLKQGQGLTLSVRLRRTEQQRSIEKVSLSSNDDDEHGPRIHTCPYYYLFPSEVV